MWQNYGMNLSPGCILMAPSDVLIDYCIWFLRWKGGFWFTVNIGCIETDGSSWAVLRTVADILTHYCIVFQSWQSKFWGEDIILLYICTDSDCCLVHWMSDICIEYCIHFQRWSTGFWGEDKSRLHTNWWLQLTCSAYNDWYAYRIFNFTWICIEQECVSWNMVYSGYLWSFHGACLS